MSKELGQKIAIKFTQDLVGDVTGNEGAFSVGGKEYQYVNGLLLDKEYQIDSITKYPIPVLHNEKFDNGVRDGVEVKAEGLVLKHTFDLSDVGGLSLWLDASQIEGLSDGDSIPEWVDKSGENRNVNANGESMPLYKEGIISGRPVVRFNSSKMTLTPDLFKNVSGADIFIVWQTSIDDATHQQVLLVASNNTGSDSRVQMRINAKEYQNRLIFGGTRTDTQSWVSVYPSAEQFSAVKNTVYLFNAIYDYANARLTARVNCNNLLTVDPFHDKGNTSNVDSASIYIGNRPTDTSPLVGDIAEIAVYDNILSSVNRESVEKYLMSKYNIGGV